MGIGVYYALISPPNSTVCVCPECLYMLYTAFVRSVLATRELVLFDLRQEWSLFLVVAPQYLCSCLSCPERSFGTTAMLWAQ